MRIGDVAYWRGAFARRLWWLVVSAPVIIAGVLVTIRDGFLPPEYRNVYFFQYLSLRWYWHWYVIGLLLYLVLVLFFLAPATTRAALRKQKQRHRESFRRYRERSVRAPQIIYRDRPEPPNLQFSVNVKRVFRDKHGVIHEQDAGAHAETDFYAVTCAIKNAISTERRVGDLIDVSAQISYRSFTYDDGQTIDRGTWLEWSSGKIGIPKNETRELIVATNEQDEFFALSMYSAPLDGRISRRTSLGDFMFPAEVRIRLISEIEGAIVAEPRFVLDRHAYINEADLLFAPIAEWRLARISEHLNSGNDLFERAVVMPAKPTAPDLRQVLKEINDDFKEWIQDVGLFLDQFWDTDHRAEFIRKTVLSKRDLNGDLLNYMVPPDCHALAKRILAKLGVLHRFQDELEDQISEGKDKPKF